MSEYTVPDGSSATLSVATQKPVATISGGGDVTLYWDEIERRAADWLPNTKDEIACWCRVLLAARRPSLTLVK